MHDSGTIYTSFSQNVQTQTSNGQQQSPFFVTLAHELGHGLSFNIIPESIRNKNWISVNTINGNKNISQDEIFAVYFENLIREENSLPIRTHYVTNQDGSINHQSEIYKKSAQKSQLMNRGDKLFISSGYEMIKSTAKILNTYLK